MIIDRLYISILSYLLNLANREGKDKLFYTVKNELLLQYGTELGVDIQYIAGKKCFTCNGEGQYSTNEEDNELCQNCGTTGWYKLPNWNVLTRYKLGKYIFHTPKERLFKEPVGLKHYSKIEGYVSHEKSKYGFIAKLILMVVFSKDYLSNRFHNAPYHYNAQGIEYRFDNLMYSSRDWLGKYYFYPIFRVKYFFYLIGQKVKLNLDKPVKLQKQEDENELPF